MKVKILTKNKKAKDEYITRLIKIEPSNYRDLQQLKLDLHFKNLAETLIFLHRFFINNNQTDKIKNALKGGLK